MRTDWLRAGMVAMAMAFGACAPVEGYEGEDPELSIDEARRSTAWLQFHGAWDVTESAVKTFVFTDVGNETVRNFFATREVQCITAPCNPVREDGTYRVTSRYIYLTLDGVETRYSFTVRGETITLRQGQRIAFVLTRRASFCQQPTDCAGQGLPQVRCLGAWTCESNTCAYRCGGTEPTGCTSNADCPETSFCSTTSCGGAGQCAPRPGACTQHYDPVCGCDGRTFGNACNAASHGVSVAHAGECEEIPSDTCSTDADCNGGFCKKDSCGAATGTCLQHLAILCSTQYEPVCGCDGRTYSNDCMANAAAVNVASRGECAPVAETCASNADCEVGAYCQKARCGAPTGTCVSNTTIRCGTQYEPVCGCDGRTYTNACMARVAGMNVEFQGACR